jgi:hypothetical protein
MTLNFILILLLVVGLIWANLALLRRGSKPMPQTSVSRAKAAKPSTGSDPKLQAVVSSAVPLAQHAAATAVEDQQQNNDQTGASTETTQSSQIAVSATNTPESSTPQSDHQA